MLFNYCETSALTVCYSNTKEQQRLKIVIQLQRNISARSVIIKYLFVWNISIVNVLFKCSGTTALEFCYSIADEQRAQSLLFNCSGTSALEVSYSIAVGHQR